MISQTFMFHNSIALKKILQTFKQPFLMHLPDNRIHKSTMLKHLQQKTLIISIPIENQWKVLWLNLGKQMRGHQISAVSFNSRYFGKFALLFCDANNSVRDINKIDFMAISASVSVTFKSAKVMDLNRYFSCSPHP